MATTLETLTRSIAFSGRLSSDDGIPDPVQMIREVLSHQYTHGTGANQANKWWAKNYSISVSSATTLDLTGGLVDPFGNTLTFTKIKELVFYRADNWTPTPGDLTTQGNFFVAMNLGAAAPIYVHPGGGIQHFSSPCFGFSVVAATTDTIAITLGAASGAADVTVYMLGIA